MAEEIRVAIVAGGHNGLVAAGYLGRAERRSAPLSPVSFIP